MKEKLITFLLRKFAPNFNQRKIIMNAGIQDMPEIARKEVIGFLIAQNMPTHHVHQNPRKKAT